MHWTRHSSIIAENKTTVSDLGNEQISSLVSMWALQEDSVLTTIPLEIGHTHSRSQATNNSARERSEVAFSMSYLRINRSIQQVPRNSPRCGNTIGRRMLQKPSAFTMEMRSSKTSQVSGQQAFPKWSAQVQLSDLRCRQYKGREERAPRPIPNSWRKKQPATPQTV